MKALLFSLAMAITTFFSCMNAQNTLTVRVSNLNDSEGTLMIALYDSQETFLSPMIKRAKNPVIQGTSAEVIFENLPNGEYAITLYQDSNNNRIFDLGEYKIPIEKYGFSNNVDPAIIKNVPTFEQCKFEINGNSTIEIKAVYAIKK